MNPLEAQAELAKRELSRRHLLDFILYNFPAYQVNWHHKLIISALEEVERGELKRLMVFVPPRMGKSEICSIQFPAWFLGKHPDKEIIAASYNADLAVEFGKKTRNLVRTKDFSNVFTGIKLSEDSAAAGKWNTNKGGAYLATGIGGGMTGRGADCLLIDDPIRDRADAESELIQNSMWDWYRSVARTRLNPGGAIILIQTRWTDKDLGGKLLDEGGEWKIIKFPAIAEEDEEFRKKGDPLWPEIVVNNETFGYSLEALEAIKKDIGPYDWAALYQQTPIDLASQEFRKAWFQYIKPEDLKKLSTRKFLTIDTAISQKSSADYTGFVHNEVNSENFWHIKSWKARISPNELIETLFSLHTTHRYTKIGIEKTIYLDALKSFIDAEQRKRNVFLPIVELKHNQVAKEVRIRGLIPRYSSKSIFHIEGECDLESELLAFPKGRHDDQIDALAYQLQLDTTVRRGVSIYRPKRIGYDGLVATRR